MINELAAAGKCVLVISSELPEVLGVSDRIYVMNEGRFVGELPAEEASQESIMRYNHAEQCAPQGKLREKGGKTT